MCWRWRQSHFAVALTTFLCPLHAAPRSYKWRSSAEFAKAAMHQQTLRSTSTTEVLDVR